MPVGYILNFRVSSSLSIPQQLFQTIPKFPRLKERMSHDTNSFSFIQPLIRLIML